MCRSFQIVNNRCLSDVKLDQWLCFVELNLILNSATTCFNNLVFNAS